MSDFLKKFLTESARLALGVLVCVSVVAGVAYAADLVPPVVNPPGTNHPAPVNVGSMYQEKTGDLYAGSIGSTDGFCIGASCLSSWPSIASGSTCQLNTLIKEQTAGTMGSLCVPTAQEAAAGWTNVSWDNCTTVRSADCQGPSYCVYQQVSCTGNVTIQPGVVTATTYSAGGSGGGGGGGCFSADTLITMADGTLKPIVDVAVGDSVLGTDEAGVTSENTVTETFIHRGDNETLLLNGSIVVTPVHPIKTQRGWVTAGELAIGDTLYTQSGSITVSSLVPGPLLASVYNLEVEPAHTYYAGGILVHNKLSEVVQN